MKILFIIPGDINLPTGGYRYDKNIINAWKHSGIDVEIISIEGNYPFPSNAENIAAIETVTTLPNADIAVVDGLLGGAAPNFIKALSKIMPVAALVHHPLSLESGLDKENQISLEKSERLSLSFTRLAITPSLASKRVVSALFNYDEARVHTVLPGVERGKISGQSNSKTVNLLCVGSIIKRKGHKDLLLALSALKKFNWKLNCIGSTQFDPTLFDELQKITEREGLSEKVKFHGSVDETVLDEAYLKADLFVLPSLYEGYGMVYAEAIVRGIPVIGTNAGAIPETIPKDCGMLVEPENIVELKHTLEQLITDEKLRNRYRDNTILAEPGFPTWETSAAEFAEILKEEL